MRIIITGATGFVGPHLCEHLLSQGDHVTAISYGIAKTLPAEVRSLDVDLRDHVVVKKVVKEVEPEAIYHLAAVSSVAAARANPRLTFEINVAGTFNVFEAASCCAKPPRVLLVSSSHVYSEEIDEVTESSPLAPANPYAVSKAMAEQVALLFPGLEYVIARPFNHSGPGQTREFVLASFAAQIAEMEAGVREPLLHVGDLNVERDFLDVRDVVRAYRLLIQFGHNGEVYNIAAGKTTSVAKVLEIFRALTSIKFETMIVPSLQRAGQRSRISADINKIKRDARWEPEIPLEKTVADLLSYGRA